jgi:hypothetical protein
MLHEQLHLPDSDPLKVTYSSPTADSGPHLEDRELDPVWQAQRGGANRVTIPTSDLSLDELKVNAAHSLAAHQARSPRQIIGRFEQ